MDIFVYIIGAVLAGLLIYFGFRKVKKRRNTHQLLGTRPGLDPEELRIENVTPGGVIQIKHGGDDGTDLDVVLSERHLYAQSDFEWIEFQGQTGDEQPVYLTVVDDDELAISMSQAKYRLDALGITEADLQEGWPKTVKYSSRSYKLQEEGDATYYRNSDTSADNGEYFTFADYKIARKSDEHPGSLTIERWESGEIQVHPSTQVDIGRITVFSNRGQE
ncbi:DUF4178 domain-containing protein [Alphaproteobacteria bacterium]|nr:DUF4178 domain-containing protein [Alphaproteobacteria bacterium]